MSILASNLQNTNIGTSNTNRDRTIISFLGMYKEILMDNNGKKKEIMRLFFVLPLIVSEMENGMFVYNIVLPFLYFQIQ
jgi:hypothetical protein